MNGVINIFKNKGMSSFDVVRKVRKVSKEKKVGHTGTLDPEATGVLPVCLGKATKIIDYIMKEEKSYFVKFKLGIKTTTYDLEGEIIEEKDWSNIKEEDVFEAINSFKGEIMQVPPMYSALKKDGVRLYDLARKGIEVEREARKITIYDISDIEISLPYVSMNVSCSKGTYIRSLCYDIGEKLSAGATMVELKRTKTSVFLEKDSINIDDLDENNICEKLISIEDALAYYEKLHINNKYKKLFLNGVNVGDKRALKDKAEKGKLYRVYDEEDSFIGLGKLDGNGFKIEKLLI
ncbi:tRNA pseudouridine55 synthase [Clostridium sp. DSM 8431]|uniref:tRNA pseudouridine(55) synthase TruB n=1 Tax=Clostridium sp. DSM 8431 TaxID=1761781 RepID=UPI0008F1AD52|nr:tRNA pseudouridine(55) synthase TruB [Clostridium sp. DSM 8431]SFU44266.1 tRNA pseudouridine55 synthase [Clostridium sp. DSM 8431]